MNQYLDIPAAWQGAELLQRRDWSRSLSFSDIAELKAAVDSVEQSTRSKDSVAPDDFPLADCGQKLTQIRRDLEEGSGACLLTGLPVDGLSEETARSLFAGLTSHLGTAVSQSAQGDRIFSVRDEGFKVGHPQARGPNTRKRLSFHTDRCDVIAFLCLKRAKAGGDNQLVSSVAIYNEIQRTRPDLVSVLMQPFYYLRHNVDTQNAQPWCQQPIFSFYEGHFACSFLRVLIDRAYAMPELPDMTPLQRESLDYLEQIAADPRFCVTFSLQPGEMLFLNNWVTLHRREEFEDHDDPAQRRHLLRIWLAVPNSRPLDPAFAANFGATEAGAVRGGMPGVR